MLKNIEFFSLQVPAGPGKLNMNDYHNVTVALSKMQVKGIGPPGAPLAASEDLDQGGYAVPRDNVVNNGSGGGGAHSEYAQPMVEQPKPRPRVKNRERRQAKQGELCAFWYSRRFAACGHVLEYLLWTNSPRCVISFQLSKDGWIM